MQGLFTRFIAHFENTPFPTIRKHFVDEHWVNQAVRQTIHISKLAHDLGNGNSNVKFYKINNDNLLFTLCKFRQSLLRFRQDY